MEDLCRSFHQCVYILRRLGVLRVLRVPPQGALGTEGAPAPAKTSSWLRSTSRATHVMSLMTVAKYKRCVDYFEILACSSVPEVVLQKLCVVNLLRIEP
jgi:hypothetical protein